MEDLFISDFTDIINQWYIFYNVCGLFSIFLINLENIINYFDYTNNNIYKYTNFDSLLLNFFNITPNPLLVPFFFFLKWIDDNYNLVNIFENLIIKLKRILIGFCFSTFITILLISILKIFWLGNINNIFFYNMILICYGFFITFQFQKIIPLLIILIVIPFYFKFFSIGYVIALCAGYFCDELFK
jgi:hypothetical protein